jgi:hypothetical protein
LRISRSLCKNAGNSCGDAYQRARQSRFTPRRKPIGLTFCPIINSSGECTRPHLLFPAPSPETSLGWRISRMLVAYSAGRRMLHARRVCSPDFLFLAQSNNSYHFFVSFSPFFAFGFFSTELLDLSFVSLAIPSFLAAFPSALRFACLVSRVSIGISSERTIRM